MGNHPIHTGMHAHTHIHTHIYLPSGTELFSPLSPLTRRARSNRSCRNSISFAEFFFSQKSWFLISVLSKPTTQHLYSDFLLLPTNLPFIHCLKKKKQQQSAPSLISRPLISLPVLTLFSGFQVLSLSPAPILFLFPNLTVMDQVFCGIEKSMYH